MRLRPGPHHWQGEDAGHLGGNKNNRYISVRNVDVYAFIKKEGAGHPVSNKINRYVSVRNVKDE